MRRLRSSLAAIALQWIAFATPGLAGECADVADELTVRRSVDQSLRESDNAPSSEEVSRLVVVTRQNTIRLAAIIKRCGWPDEQRFGPVAAEGAWLLAQHSDHDRAFQRQARRLIKDAVRRRVTPAKHFAYLSDRLAVADGKRQLFGTQFRSNDGCTLQLLPVDSREAADRRRREIGMGTLAEYEQYAHSQFQPANCDGKPTPH